MDNIDEIDSFNARTLIYQGLAQTDLDMNNRRLLNLDDSNLNFGSAPPTVGPVAHKWLRSWNSTTRVWGLSQPAFSDISGSLSTGSGGQQRAITELGTINVGVWNATTLGASRVPNLSGLRAPTANVDMANFKLVNLGLPVNGGDSVNLAYVNAMLPGLHVKEAVQCATTTNIVLSGVPKTVDNFPVQDQMRVLVKNQTNPAHNGIYRAHPGAWLRAPDSDTADELEQAYCFVHNGDFNGSTAWVQVNDIATLETSPLNYIFFSVGTSGPPGPPGPGVPSGGATGMILKKLSSANYDTGWFDGSSAFALKDHGLPDYALLTGTIDLPDVVGPPVDGMIIARWSGAPEDKKAIWIDGSVIYDTHYAQIDHGLPDQALLTGTIDAPDVYGDPVDGMIIARLASAPQGKKAVYVDGSLLFAPFWNGLPPGGTQGQIVQKDLTLPGLNKSKWVTPSPSGAIFSILQTGQSGTLGTSNTTGEMMGLNRTITLLSTGKVVITVAGWISNDNSGAAVAQMYVGTGTPPSHGDAATGTAVGTVALRGALGAGRMVPFSLPVAITGAVIGTPIWIDLLLIAGTPGTATVGQVTISAYEIA